MQLNTAQCSSKQFKTALTAQCSLIQLNAAQCSSIEFNADKCGSIQQGHQNQKVRLGSRVLGWFQKGNAKTYKTALEKLAKAATAKNAANLNHVFFECAKICNNYKGLRARHGKMLL